VLQLFCYENFRSVFAASRHSQVAKVCNNLILAISMAGVSEAMNLGVKLGADPKVLASIVNTSSGRCWSSDTYNPVPGVLPTVPSSREYSGMWLHPSPLEKTGSNDIFGCGYLYSLARWLCR
jgi:hypothetical protein